MHFEDLRLIEPLLRALRTEGYTSPTPIQCKAVPHVLEGKDLMGCAQTGTGKTAAFALPIIQRLAARNGHATPARARTGSAGRPPIRSLVLTPTRELAAQIGESFEAYGRHMGLRHTVIFGGVKQNRQVEALRRGVDILVATPGRLLDLLGQRHLSLRDVGIFVLDEADRMLDMGFIHDVRRVIRELPTKRQTLLFSATLPLEIRNLAATILREPVTVKAGPTVCAAADTVDQALYHVDASAKTALLEDLLDDPQVSRVLVFTRTKHRANRVAKQLLRAKIAAEAIHSNRSQNARLRALANFKQGTTRVLVASDIASRGLDVDAISHVVNYDLPDEPQTYIHRIGRTGRAGATGQAISFCSSDQRKALTDIERLLGQTIAVRDHAIAPAIMASINVRPAKAPRTAATQGATPRGKSAPVARKGAAPGLRAGSAVHRRRKLRRQPLAR